MTVVKLITIFFLSGLTIGRFTAALKQTMEFGHAAQIDQPSAGLQRFEYDQVEHFIEFITYEDVCMSAMAFGERYLNQLEHDLRGPIPKFRNSTRILS